jgi:hypothetical protein
MITIIAGFAALTIDTGMNYSQSRTDHDISDAASLAAAYWVTDYPSATAGLTLSGLYQAAQLVGNLDGCNRGQCQVPLVVVGTNKYSDLEVWTTAFTSTTSTPPNIYVSSTGTCSATVTGSFILATCPAVNAIVDVGAPVGDTTSAAFSGVIGAGSTSVVAGAVAAVSGSAGSGGTSLPCEVCILGNFVSNDSGTIEANNGDIDIGGYLNLAAGSGGVIETTNSHSIAIYGSDTTASGYVYNNAGATTIQACQTINGSTCTLGGNVYINGKAYISSSNVIQGGTVNISGAVTNPSGTMSDSSSANQANNTCVANYETDAITPCPYGTAAPSPSTLSDPLSGATYALPACSGTCPSSAQTITSSIALTAGIYYGLTISNTATVNFAPGVYVFDGSGIQVTGGGPTLSCTACSGTSGVTFYFTCNSGSSKYTPTACTPTTGQKGARFYITTNTTISLAAPTTGPEGNMLFWFDPKDSCTSDGNDNACLDLAGGSWNFSGSSGALYMADSILYKTNTLALSGPIIVGAVSGNGSTLALGTLTGPTLVKSTASAGNLAQ